MSRSISIPPGGTSLPTPSVSLAEKGIPFSATDSQSPPKSDECVKVAQIDYSGAAKKTCPKEIKLVRKLDMYLMVGSPHIAHKPRGIYLSFPNLADF